MKEIFFILILTIGLLSCNVSTEKAGDNTSISETTGDSPRAYPLQFELTDTSMIFNPGDYYLGSNISYYFSGKGDENSMDETPYLEESSKCTLDSIVNFLNHKSSISVVIYFVDDQYKTFDSCVPCNFEWTIKDYLVSNGIREDRIICGHYEGAGPAVDSIEGFQLIINKVAQKQ